MASEQAHRFHALEQPAGEPSVPPVSLELVDKRRRGAFDSWEAYLRDMLRTLDAKRGHLWRRDYSSPAAYVRSVEPMRQTLKQMLGFWVEPVDRPGLDTANEEVLLETPWLLVKRFELEMLPGLWTYAVTLTPKGPAGRRPGLLVQHGYGGTPEAACGLTPGANAADYSYRSLGLRAAKRGYQVMSVFHPAGYGKPVEAMNRIPGSWAEGAIGPALGHNRLHRYATLAGGTLLGLYTYASSRGVDWLCQCPGVDGKRIGVYGLSQGGQTALFLPALDVRVKASVASAYFSQRLAKFIGPHRSAPYLDWFAEDPFIRDFVRFFSDADVASLICPRALAVEAGAADTSVDFEKAKAEFAAAAEHYYHLGITAECEFIPHAHGHVSATQRAFDFLGARLSVSAAER